MNLKPSNPFKKKNCFLYDSGCLPVYSENYQNIEEVKYRILELNREWKKGKFYRYRKNYSIFCLNNSWNDIMHVGICDPLGWKVNNTTYTLEYLNKKINNESQKIFNFYIPFLVECDRENIVSVKTATHVIKDCLDTNRYTQYCFNELG